MSSRFKLPIIYICITTVLLLGAFGIVWAASNFNEQINFQGKLNNAADVAVPTEKYNFRFRLCITDDCTDGSDPIWTETLCYSPNNGTTCDGTGTDQRIQVTNGLFTVLLGSISSFSSVNFNQVLYLEVQVGDSTTTPDWESLAPLKTLGAVPAAFEAKNLGGKTWAVPDAIGSSTPNSGAFTTLSITPATDTTALTLTGTNVASANLAYLNSKNTSGTIFNLAYGAAATLGGTLTGVALDLSTNVTAIGQSVTGQTITLPAVTNVGAGTYAYKGLTITGGNLIQNTDTGTDTWTGLDIAMPLTLTQTTGTVTAIGLNITGPTSVTSATRYGLIIDDNAGNIGFGDTAPAAKLEIAQTDAANDEALIIDTEESTATQNVFSIISDVGAGETTVFNIDADGSITNATSLSLTPGSDVIALTLTGTNVASANLAYLNSKNTSGTIFNLAYGAAATLGGSLTGAAINLSTNVTAIGQSVTGQTITLPAVTNVGAGTYAYKGLTITGGNLIQNTDTGTDTWTGLDIAMPLTLTQTTGTVTAIGLNITGPTSVTSATRYGLIIDDNAGNVGIGTTTPLLLLDVAGSVRFTGAALSPLTGTIDPAASTTVTGVGTKFLTELVPGDMITVSTETRTVTAIASDTSLTVGDAFSNNGNDESPDKLPAVFVARDSSNALKVFMNYDGDLIVDKLTANTWDPVYNINGTRYATYGVAMTGVKEETTGIVNIQEQVEGQDYYQYVVDFNSLEEGSDLWLFAKTTNMKQNIDKLVVLLSPAGRIRVWYQVDPSQQKFYLYSSAPTTLSYRLTAPRFDWESWPNLSEGGAGGLVINDDGSITGSDGSVYTFDENKNIASFSSDENVFDVANILQSIKDYIKEALSSLTGDISAAGSWIFDNIFVRNAKVDNLEVQTGITIYDKVTGDPYCTEIENGNLVTKPGKCEERQSSASKIESVEGGEQESHPVENLEPSATEEISTTDPLIDGQAPQETTEQLPVDNSSVEIPTESIPFSENPILENPTLESPIVEDAAIPTN